MQSLLVSPQDCFLDSQHIPKSADVQVPSYIVARLQIVGEELFIVLSLKIKFYSSYICVSFY